MLITFLENTRYSEDGFVVQRGHKDETREVADTAARALIWAKKALRVPTNPQTYTDKGVPL